MLLQIDGDLNKYYIQTLCMLFYPGAKFAEDDDDKTQSAHFIRVDRDNGVEVSCTFRAEDKSGQATHFEPVGGASMHLGCGSNSDPTTKASKLAAGIAALEAGKQLFGTIPAWGILTGIRPAKLASELLMAHSDDGARLYTPSDIRSMLQKSFLVNPRKAALAVDIAKNEQKIARLARNGKSPTCSVYISIPFCPTRCAYCSFVSYTSKRLLSLIPEYIDRLCRDITQLFAYLKSSGFRVMTIYIGGGTPTTLEPELLKKLLETISRYTDTSKLAEYTLEGGRPDTITEEKLRVALEYGVGRMSINPQTMNDNILRAIGRRHTVDDFCRAYSLAREVGIPIINTDLIAGLPGDDFVGFSKSVDRIIGLAPENITVHTFCVKKSAEILKIDTEIYNRSADETVKGVDYSQIKLKNSGYLPYYIYRQKNTVGNLENVGFSIKGAEGLYNVLMMEELHSIFAVGAGAVTKLVGVGADKKKCIQRIFEPKYPYEYLSEAADASMNEKFAAADKMFTY